MSGTLSEVLRLYHFRNGSQCTTRSSGPHLFGERGVPNFEEISLGGGELHQAASQAGRAPFHIHHWQDERPPRCCCVCSAYGCGGGAL